MRTTLRSFSGPVAAAMTVSDPTTLPDPYIGFRATLNDARRRLTDIAEQRDQALQKIAECDAEIVNLRRVIVSLAAMVGEPTEVWSSSLTRRIR